MANVSTSIDIDAPVQDVWNVATDLNRLGEWVTIHQAFASPPPTDQKKALFGPGPVALQDLGGHELEDWGLHGVQRGEHPGDRPRPRVGTVRKQAPMCSAMRRMIAPVSNRARSPSSEVGINPNG